jgi:formimidoylglutamate deiminase
VMLDAGRPALAGLCATDMLSSHVFASHRTNALAAAWVAGQRRVGGGLHPLHHDAAAAFVAARSQLLTASP